MAKTIGIGAVCSVVVQYLHPSKLIKDKYPSRGAKERLGNLVAIRRETLKVNRVDRVCIVFRHDDFPNQLLHCCERWTRVDTEGPPDSFFGSVADDTVEEEGRPLPQNVNAGSLHLGDALLVRAEGFDVDDDNDPAPENIPTPGEVIQDAQQWGWSGICNRKSLQVPNSLPKLVGRSDSESASMTILSLFMLLFPLTYLHEVLLVELNKNLQQQGQRACGFGEFLRFFGIWFYMSSFKGFTREQYWTSKEIDQFDGAPVRFHEWMSKRRFDMLLGCLDYTNRQRPAYKDKFHGIRQLIEAWNENMAAKFLPSWVSCLDESMSPWTTRWTCPGWVFVPRKPKPFGNEYHSVCCAVSGLMWGIELVEGKDAPPEARVPGQYGKTCGLLLRMCQTIAGRGMVVILDSGFCVLKGLVELKKMGVFASAVIKKRFFVWKCGNKVPITFIQFRRQLAKALIFNDHMTVEEDDLSPRKSSKRLRGQSGHDKLVAPNHARSFHGSRWDLTAKDRYQKYTCKTPGCRILI